MTKQISKTVRASINLSGTNYPIEIVPGYAAPTLKGRSYYWTTPGGQPVYHPNAYRRAWGKPVYNASSRRIEVGQGWIEANIGTGHADA